MTDLLSPASTRVDATPFEVAHAAATRRTRSPRWIRQYVASLVLTDFGVVLLAVALTFAGRFYVFNGRLRDPELFLTVCVALVLGWIGALAVVGAYEARHITTGAEELRRLILGTLVTAGATAIFCYVAHIDIARGFVAGVVPVGLVLLVAGRMFSRHAVRTRRAAGVWSYRILVAGTEETVRHFLDLTRRSPEAGMRVVGACVEDAVVGSELAPGVPVLGGVTRIADVAADIDAEVVALAGAGLGPSTIRQLGWSLEGTGRDLVMVPGLTEVAGPRVHVTPVEGLPLMWVDRPVLRGYRRILKRGVDAAVAGLLLVLLAPVFALIGVLIKADTRGPVFFRQVRFGKRGRPFRIWKFRSMTADASTRHDEVVGTDTLFAKAHHDPRVTRVGRVLRKLSLDELPQLVNVLTGSMSLVGPRPQCDHEVASYDLATGRRLMVKPGMTGLWQVSGRSDLAAEDGVRLDLYYVENWSLALDLAIIARTVHAVVRGSGAY